MKRRRVCWVITAMSLGLVGISCGSDNGSPGGDAAVNADVMMGSDAAGSDGGAVDAATVDAGPICGPNDMGACQDSSLECLCCPAGGPMSNCLCTTTCTSDNDCTDAVRPMCNQMNPGDPGICTATDYGCAWGSVCAAPDTPVATPHGMRPMSGLRVGDLVYSLHGSSMLAVPLVEVSRTAVWNHSVLRVRLSNGVVLHISPGHPRADGRSFAGLVAGDTLGEVRVSGVQKVSYVHPYTYDILPASDTGTYVAGGALIGSTLR